jgi:DNA-directed RNA polymerase subunit RPC12/RpoP
LIIACPECTSPFQVLDDQIAELVQIECPTCTFRMILDFAAANDAALREAGMQYTQGFRDEATYRQAVGAEGISYASSAPAPQAAAAELRVMPEPEPEPEPLLEPTPEPVRRASFTPAPAATPVQPAATPVQPVQPQAEPVRSKPPVRARPTLIAHTAPPPVRQPSELTPPTGTVAVEPHNEAAIDTHVGPAPQGEVAAPVEVPRPADDAQLEVAGDEFAVDFDEPEPEPRTRPPAEHAEHVHHAEQLRTPPHSPAQPSMTRPTPDEPELADAPAVETKPPEKVEQTPKKGSALRTAFLMLLLLVLIGAAGLMGWSVIETQDPNPLPMLKDKFGIDLGFGIPATPAQPDAPAADTAAAPDDAAGDKAGAQ